VASSFSGLVRCGLLEGSPGNVITAALALAAIAARAAMSRADPPTVRVPCEGCDEWPIWLQAILVAVGVGLALAVLYVPLWLSRRARSPRQVSWILFGGIALGLAAIIGGARLLVVLFPG
jgi:hypothetical protein